MKTKTRMTLMVLFSFLAFPLAADEIFPLTHCRIVDTRWTAPPLVLSLGVETVFNATLTDNTSQGGHNQWCGVPVGASAILASVVVVNPTGPGYMKAWDTGGQEPQRGATALNFFWVNDLVVPSYPAAPGRLSLIKLNGAGEFSLEMYWFTGNVVVDVQAYTLKVNQGDL